MTIADLHIHSRFSRATSRDGDAPHLDMWARRKGISIVGTGDFTHPAWRAELKEHLVPAEDGFYTLKKELALPSDTTGETVPRFVLTSEISCIYKKNGRVRKVHNVIILPGLEEADILSKKLEAIGNIHSDGRPILGLDSRDLLEITLESCPDAIFIPAHIWTPHFSVFGAFSGFNTLEECFEDLTPHIHALETGLSSDPPMNWRVSALDPYIMVSHSDAHSPQKLGREADLLDIPFCYGGLKTALDTGEGFKGTLEFFPEEGKYHLDGHRNCGICLTPSETAALGGKCPVCGKKITIGVEHRVEELADRPEGFVPENARPFESIAPLPEVIAASTGVSAASKRTQALYLSLLGKLGPEFDILRNIPVEDIRHAGGACLAEGIRRLRAGEVQRKPGFDGEYGTFTLLTPDEIDSLSGQTSLFAVRKPSATKKKASSLPAKAAAPEQEEADAPAMSLNEHQLEAVHASDDTVAVIAGPGTGKTGTLVSRITYLIEHESIRPSQITAVTFTAQAAQEMRTRLEERLGKKAIRGMTIGTFHAICRKILGKTRLVSRQEALDLMRLTIEQASRSDNPRTALQTVSKIKSGISDAGEDDLFEDYQNRLHQQGLMDFDDLLTAALKKVQNRRSKQPLFPWLLVDEFQDVNELQYQLTLQWSQGGNLFVIGDPDQAIYGFRGAGSRCFERLAEDRPSLRQIRLTENYRSTSQILKCSLPVISVNEGAPRELHAQHDNPSAPPVRLVCTHGDYDEASFIAGEIVRMTGGIDMLQAGSPHARESCRSFSEMAVLCRTHRQLERIEKALHKRSIPCVITGREDFLDDDEIRGVLSFFRSLLDPEDIPSFRYALRYCFNCPADLAEMMCAAAAENPSLESLIEKAAEFPPLIPWTEKASAFSAHASREKPLSLLEEWCGEEKRSAAMEKLLGTAVFFHSMPDLLNALLEENEGDLPRASGKKYASGAVRLMTLHGAKGLEFPAVFLAGVRKGLLPLEASEDEAEERRLFYVGMTRAKEELILVCPRPEAEERSPFLNDIPAGLLKTETLPAFAPERVPEQLSLF